MPLKYQAKGVTHLKKLSIGKDVRGGVGPKIERSGQVKSEFDSFERKAQRLHGRLKKLEEQIAIKGEMSKYKNEVDHLRDSIARLVFSTKYQGLTTSYVTQKTTDGYSALFRIFFAYSALDLLLPTKKKKSNVLTFDVFQKTIGSIDGLSLDTLSPTTRLTLVENEKLLEKLITYSESGSEDLKKVYESKDTSDKGMWTITKSLRHLVVHGYLNPSGSGLQVKKMQIALRDLGHAIDCVTHQCLLDGLSYLEREFAE